MYLKKLKGKMNKQEKINEFRHKCNFLTKDGDCMIGSSHTICFYSKRCNFENCIFMKILKIKEVK